MARETHSNARVERVGNEQNILVVKVVGVERAVEAPAQAGGRVVQPRGKLLRGLAAHAVLRQVQPQGLLPAQQVGFVVTLNRKEFVARKQTKRDIFFVSDSTKNKKIGQAWCPWNASCVPSFKNNSNTLRAAGRRVH